MATQPTYTIPPHQMSKSGSHWSSAERARFEDAVRRYGPYAWTEITRAVGTRAEKQVKAFAGRNRQSLKHLPQPLSQHENHQTHNHSHDHSSSSSRSRHTSTTTSHLHNTSSPTSSSSTTYSSSSSSAASTVTSSGKKKQPSNVHHQQSQHRQQQPHSTGSKSSSHSSRRSHQDTHANNLHNSHKETQKSSSRRDHRSSHSKLRRQTDKEKNALLGMGVMMDTDDALYAQPRTRAAALVTDDFFSYPRSRPTSEDGAPQDPLAFRV